MTNNYEVGRGRPPKRHQFRKGKSGNPAGRPKRKFTTKEHFELQKQFIRELNSDVTITEDGQRKTVTKAASLVKSFVARAFKGDKTAQKYVWDFMSKLPKDAFVDEGNQTYEYKISEKGMEAIE